jgi:hypothetical protein
MYGSDPRFLPAQLSDVDLNNCYVLQFLVRKTGPGIGVLLHDDIECCAFGFGIIYECGLSVSDDTLILHGTGAWIFGFDSLEVNIEFKADIIVALDDIDLLSFFGAMEIEGISHVAEAHGNDVRHAAIAQGDPADL